MKTILGLILTGSVIWSMSYAKDKDKDSKDLIALPIQVYESISAEQHVLLNPEALAKRRFERACFNRVLTSVEASIKEKSAQKKLKELMNKYPKAKLRLAASITGVFTLFIVDESSDLQFSFMKMAYPEDESSNGAEILSITQNCPNSMWIQSKDFAAQLISALDQEIDYQHSKPPTEKGKFKDRLINGAEILGIIFPPAVAPDEPNQ